MSKAETKKSERYLYEVWVSADRVDTLHFPANKKGFIQAFERADELCETECEVEVYVHRWDYTDIVSDRTSYHDSQGFAYVGWNDQGEPEDLDTDLGDCDGVLISRIPKYILNAFDQARNAYIKGSN